MKTLLLITALSFVVGCSTVDAYKTVIGGAAEKTSVQLQGAAERYGIIKKVVPKISLKNAKELTDAHSRIEAIEIIGLKPSESKQNRDMWQIERSGDCKMDQVTIYYSQNGKVESIMQTCGDVTSIEPRRVNYRYSEELPSDVVSIMRPGTPRKTVHKVLGIPNISAEQHSKKNVNAYKDTYETKSGRAIEIFYVPGAHYVAQVQTNNKRIPFPQAPKTDFFE